MAGRFRQLRCSSRGRRVTGWPLNTVASAYGYLRAGLDACYWSGCGAVSHQRQRLFAQHASSGELLTQEWSFAQQAVEAVRYRFTPLNAPLTQAPSQH